MNFQGEEVEIWILNVASMSRSDFKKCNSVLSLREKTKMSKLRFGEDREAYCAAHGLCRMALSYRCGMRPPESWQFQVSRLGRPEIATIDSEFKLRFNISHTRGMVACVVTSGLDCGVDVEKVSRFTGIGGLAETVLTDSEFKIFSNACEHQRSLIFSRLWTLKESYVKATGDGLNTPLMKVGFDLMGAIPRLMSSNGSWFFSQRVLCEGYVVSAATKSLTEPSFLYFDTPAALALLSASSRET